jgi:hypothetical protein
MQKRNNSYRVQHYQGFVNGQRIYAYHSIPVSIVDSLNRAEVNGSKSVEVKDFKSAPVDQKVGAGRLAWLGHWLYEPKVAGSSPVRPTNHLNSHCSCRCLMN